MSRPTVIAYKAYEIEEFVDIYFFRRLGIVVAHAAGALKLTPNAVSVLAGLVGLTGGLLLADDRLVPLGLTLIVAYGVLDSADGQLARLTGRTSEWGRVLDGAAGYATHTAAYIAIIVRSIRGGDPVWWAVGLGLLAGLMTAIHAQLYDYHRTAYATIVVKGRPSLAPQVPGGSDGVLGAYESLQRRLAGAHPEVEGRIAADAVDGQVTAADRARYRACFYPLMPGWNMLGDNMRRYGFIVLAWVHHLEWYFAFVLIPLNVLAVVMWLLQRGADRAFLNGEHPPT